MHGDEALDVQNGGRYGYAGVRVPAPTSKHLPWWFWFLLALSVEVASCFSPFSEGVLGGIFPEKQRMRPKGGAGGNATETLYLLHIYLRMRVVSAGLASGGDLPETHRDVASMLLRNVDIGVGLNTVEEDYEGGSIKKASILFILSISAFIDELKSAAVVRIELLAPAWTFSGNIE